MRKVLNFLTISWLLISTWLLATVVETIPTNSATVEFNTEPALIDLVASTQLVRTLINNNQLAKILENHDSDQLELLLNNFSPAEIAFEIEIKATTVPLVLSYYYRSDQQTSKFLDDLNQLAQQYPEQVKFIVIDGDQLFTLAESSEITVFPTILFSQAGTVLQRQTGPVTIKQLKQLIAQVQALQTMLAQIQQFTQDPDPETRYLGLHFLAKLIERDQALDFAEELLLALPADPTVLVQTQVMWLYGKLVQKGRCLDQAQVVAEQAAQQADPVLKFWAGELLAELVSQGRARSAAQQFLATQQDTPHILLATQLKFLRAQLDPSVELTKPVLNLITPILQAPEQHDHYWGLYCLAKLVDAGQVLDQAEMLVSDALQKLPHVKLQAMWVLSRLVAQGQCLEQGLIIAQQAAQNSDWHVRLGGLIILAELKARAQSPKLAKLWQQYQSESHGLVKFYFNLIS